MPRVIFASALARWIRPAGDANTGDVAVNAIGTTITEVLDSAFAQHPNLRAYVLDEHGSVRHHLALFVDGASLRDKRALDQRVANELYVMQALSGG